MEIAELDAMLKAAKQPEKTVPVCLRGDLQADWEELDRDLTELRSKGTSTLAGNPAEEKLASRIRALEADMAEATLHLRLRAMRRKAWLKLIEEHPPRKDNEIDKVMGMNGETFFPALITQSLVTPELDEERVEELLDAITSAQYDSITNVVWALNRQDVSVPFSYTASRITASSAETSKPRSGSASRTSGSLAGNRKKSPNTSTTPTAD